MTAAEAVEACLAICRAHKLDADWNGSSAMQAMRALIPDAVVEHRHEWQPAGAVERCECGQMRLQPQWGED